MNKIYELKKYEDEKRSLQLEERENLRTRLKERHNYLSELETRSGVRLGSSGQSSCSLERYGSIESGGRQNLNETI